MHESSVKDFVGRLKMLLESKTRVAFFLGAGTSVSSGIPSAPELTDQWLHKLHELGGPRTDFEDWLHETFPDHDDANPAGTYSKAMRALFREPADQQREIERIVCGRDPGFAYATLAQLLAHEAHGERCNLVLTTNFDDLVADALYLFTRVRPLVVTHEALAAYADEGRARPTIMKLHGDAMLEPRNMEEEIRELPRALVKALKTHLRSRALVFIGYGGHDVGVTSALARIPRTTLNHGIFWVNDKVPQNDFGKWLNERGALWVRHLDFDELMVVVKDRFDLPHPTDQRFTELLRTYQETFSRHTTRVRAQHDAASEVAKATEAVGRRFENWFAVAFDAGRYHEKDPTRAEGIYEEGIRQFPSSDELLDDYAKFLESVRKDHDRADQLYLGVIEAKKQDPTNLGNYAVFLADVRKDADRAEEMYRRAIEADPNHAVNRGRHAKLLFERHRDESAIQELGRALDLAKSRPEAERRDSLAVELAFYLYAHVPERHAEGLKQLRELLRDGVRSPSWDLSGSLRRAREDGDERLDFLEALVRVINDEAPLDSLSTFDYWHAVV